MENLAHTLSQVNFEIHARLMHRLFPDISAIVVLTQGGEVVWQEGIVSDDMHKQTLSCLFKFPGTDSASKPANMYRFTESRLLCCSPLNDVHGLPLAVIGILFRGM
ncbi:MAG: hypothetical protein C0631_07895 [Sedimenticola sp.]|nr:MAG: hypothetical protein C0631_07895 [Sedimenticola sp.]